MDTPLIIEISLHFVFLDFRTNGGLTYIAKKSSLLYSDKRMTCRKAIYHLSEPPWTIRNSACRVFIFTNNLVQSLVTRPYVCYITVFAIDWYVKRPVTIADSEAVQGLTGGQGKLAKFNIFAVFTGICYTTHDIFLLFKM